MKYIKLFIIAYCFVAGFSGLSWSQSGNPSTSGKFVLKNDAGNTLTLAIPSSGVTNYMLTFPAVVGATGSLPYLTNNTGSLGWTTPGTNGQVLTIVGGVPAWANPSNSGGTVTSVGLQMPSVLFSSVSNSPITSSGTLIPQLATQAANTVFAGPTSGANSTPTFRTLVATDIPSGSTSYIQNSTTLQPSSNYHISGNGEVEGQLQLKGTGTGITTFQAGAQGATNINYTLPITTPTAGQILSSSASGILSWITPSNSGGTVTSVGLAMPSIFTVSGSPVTTSGTLTAALATENANLVFAGPSSGAAATPTFRALTTSDIPNLSNSYIVNGTTLQTANFNISGNGDIGGLLQFQGTGTGVTTFQAGAQGAANINYTLPITAPTAGQILSSTASGILSWITPSNSGGTVTSVGLSLPSIFNVTGSPVTTSGTLTGTLANESANLIFAGPVSGVAGAPTFRGLVPADFNNSAWTITGNSGTSAGTNFVGTTDTAAFEIHVNNTGSAGQGNGRVMRYIPNTTSANILGGYNGNTISSTIYGATISGGGSSGNIQNIITIYGTIAGGMGNLVCGNYGIVGGGKNNISGGLVSAVLGGETNTANGIGSSIVGGRELWLGDYSVGYNGESGATLTNLSAMSNIAYFGNVDLMIGNINSTPRALRFYGPNSSANYTGAFYTSFAAQAQTANIIYNLPSVAPTANQVLTSSGGATSNLSWTNASSGTVSSVGLAMPSIFTVSNSPVTSSGTLTASLNTQSANLFFAGPSTGAASTPTFRAIAPTDLNGAAWGLTGNSGTVAGTNFIGTTDSIDFVTKVHNIERMRLRASDGFMTLGGNFTPLAPLHIKNANAGHAALYLQNTDTTGYSSIDFLNNSGTIVNIGASNTGAGAFPNQFYFNVSAGKTVPITFNQQTVEKMAVDTNGNIYIANNMGVGTKSMNTKVDIDGGLSIRPSTPSAISASGQITVGNRSYIRITHDANANTYTMTLSNGLQDGQVLIIQCAGIDGTHPFKFADGGTLEISGDFVPNTNNSTISLIWDGTEWVETARSLN